MGGLFICRYLQIYDLSPSITRKLRVTRTGRFGSCGSTASSKSPMDQTRSVAVCVRLF